MNKQALVFIQMPNSEDGAAAAQKLDWLEHATTLLRGTTTLSTLIGHGYHTMSFSRVEVTLETMAALVSSKVPTFLHVLTVSKQRHPEVESLFTTSEWSRTFGLSTNIINHLNNYRPKMAVHNNHQPPLLATTHQCQTSRSAKKMPAALIVCQASAN